jgi:hypothetical protein
LSPQAEQEGTLKQMDREIELTKKQMELIRVKRERDRLLKADEDEEEEETKKEDFDYFSDKE